MATQTNGLPAARCLPLNARNGAIAQPELIAKLSRFTFPFDMTGSPALTMPAGFSEAGLPIAFQLVAADLGEAILVRAGAAFQDVTLWHRRHPVA
jgi:amidase